MPKAFSVASWNVEHFSDDPERVNRVVEFLKAQKPDVFGLYEVEGRTVFDALRTKMPNYVFQITEGPQTQEILVGVRNTISAFITQKIEFRAGTTHMRPGQLVTVTKRNVTYMLLFLHLSSGTNPRGMGLRDDMLERAFEFRKVLDKASGGTGKARYLFLGDLNTMGLEYPFDRDIDPTLELRKWDRYGVRKSIGMRRLEKTHPRELVQRQQVVAPAVEPRPRVRDRQPDVPQLPPHRRRRGRGVRARLGGPADRRRQGRLDRPVLRPLAAVLRSAGLRRRLSYCAAQHRAGAFRWSAVRATAAAAARPANGRRTCGTRGAGGSWRC